MKRLTPVVLLIIISLGGWASGFGGHMQSNQVGQREPSRNSRASSSITGLVVSANGERMADVSVGLSPLSGEPWAWNRSGRAAITGPDGRFEFENVVRGVYVVAVYSYDFSLETAICRAGDSVMLRVSNSKGGVITGRVTDVNGKPAIEAPVTAIRLRDSEGRSTSWWSRQRGGLTDDRGIYRIWGIPVGSYIISAGAKSEYWGAGTPRPYDNEPPTYFPSSSAAGAVEVILHETEERTGIDIRLLEGTVHTIKGRLAGAIENGSDRYFGVALWGASAGAPSFARPEQATGEFKFDRVASGDYCLQAFDIKAPETITGKSDVTHVVVRDSDVTGLSLIVKPHASIAGKVSIERPSADVVKACSQLTEPVMEETMISLYPGLQPHLDPGTQCLASSSPLTMSRSLEGNGIIRTIPDARGKLSINALESGRYRIEVETPNDNYYIKSIAAPQPRSKRPADIGRSGIDIKGGEQVADIAITLSPGAAALSGVVAPRQPDLKLPSGVVVFLIPAEEDSADDALRFAESPVGSGGEFAFKNVAPGRYFLIVRSDQVRQRDDKPFRRLWWDDATRAALRSEAENANVAVNLKPCEKAKNHVLVYDGK